MCCPCLFGRSCLRTNDGYVSEVGASVVDRFFGFNIVPRTELVHLAAATFSYPLWDRFKAGKKDGGGLPRKVGSFQLFAQGFRPSEEILAEMFEKIIDDLKEQLDCAFQSEFERLVMLDYIIRNTDRSMDNWLIHLSWKKDQSPMALVKIAAIDNGLAFPYKHPDNWRSYPYGWQNLPQAHQPFSQATRQKFLPLFRDHSRIEGILFQHLSALFRRDQLKPHYNSVHFYQQLSVMRGQLANLVEALEAGETPAQLVARTPLLIQDDQIHAPKRYISKPDTEYSTPSQRRWRTIVSAQPCFSCF